jgi:hypothetical protein
MVACLTALAIAVRDAVGYRLGKQIAGCIAAVSLATSYGLTLATHDLSCTGFLGDTYRRHRVGWIRRSKTQMPWSSGS